MVVSSFFYAYHVTFNVMRCLSFCFVLFRYFFGGRFFVSFLSLTASLLGWLVGWLVCLFVVGYFCVCVVLFSPLCCYV